MRERLGKKSGTIGQPARIPRVYASLLPACCYRTRVCGGPLVESEVGWIVVVRSYGVIDVLGKIKVNGYISDRLGVGYYR